MSQLKLRLVSNHSREVSCEMSKISRTAFLLFVTMITKVNLVDRNRLPVKKKAIQSFMLKLIRARGSSIYL